MLIKQVKDSTIAEFQTHKGDTGSAPVQIALLTKEVEFLTQHLRIHKKDVSSRRGLIKKVSQRRRLLKFLRQNDVKHFDKIIKKLHLRKPVEFTAVEEDIKLEERQNELMDQVKSKDAVAVKEEK